MSIVQPIARGRRSIHQDLRIIKWRDSQRCEAMMTISSSQQVDNSCWGFVLCWNVSTWLSWLIWLSSVITWFKCSSKWYWSNLWYNVRCGLKIHLGSSRNKRLWLVGYACGDSWFFFLWLQPSAKRQQSIWNKWKPARFYSRIGSIITSHW